MRVAAYRGHWCQTEQGKYPPGWGAPGPEASPAASWPSHRLLFCCWSSGSSLHVFCLSHTDTKFQVPVLAKPLQKPWCRCRLKMAVNVLPCRDLIFFLITWAFFLPPEDRDIFVEGRIWLYVDKFILNYSTQMGIGALNNNIWPLFIGI